MNSLLRHTSAAVLAFGMLAAPAFAGPAPGTAPPGGASQQAVPSDAAGSTGVPGSNSATGVNTDNGSDMNKSSAELPNNDAGTPINNGPNGAGAMHPSTKITPNPPSSDMPHAVTPGSGTSGQ